MTKNLGKQIGEVIEDVVNALLVGLFSRPQVADLLETQKFSIGADVKGFGPWLRADNGKPDEKFLGTEEIAANFREAWIQSGDEKIQQTQATGKEVESASRNVLENNEIVEGNEIITASGEQSSVRRRLFVEDGGFPATLVRSSLPLGANFEVVFSLVKSLSRNPSICDSISQVWKVESRPSQQIFSGGDRKGSSLITLVEFAAGNILVGQDGQTQINREILEAGKKQKELMGQEQITKEVEVRKFSY
uniref:Uncharacterized protein n=1 Tax=Nelumbo nucifera TaxID=4432 RepID=A0A822XR47_NELNU|nr:TPA_asm: hypothetical protein HUJ06_023606 [Nelumbo nucifera]